MSPGWTLGSDDYGYGFLRQPDSTIVRFFLPHQRAPRKSNPRSRNPSTRQARSLGLLVHQEADLRMAFFGKLTARSRGSTSETEGGPFLQRSTRKARSPDIFTCIHTPTQAAASYGRTMALSLRSMCLTNSTATYATAMNDAGDITGYYLDAS